MTHLTNEASAREHLALARKLKRVEREAREEAIRNRDRIAGLQLEPVQPRHIDVENQAVEVPHITGEKQFLGGTVGPDLKALADQEPLQGSQDTGLIVHQANCVCAVHCDRRYRNQGVGADVWPAASHGVK